MKKFFFLSVVIVYLLGCTSDDLKWDLLKVDRLPDVTTKDATVNSNNSAILNGEVKSFGTSIVTRRGFCYSTSPNPDFSSNTVSVGSGDGIFNIEITGLVRNQDYYVKAFAENSKGVVFGVQKTFTTTNISNNLPVISTVGVTNATSSSASSGGIITSDGGSSIIEKGVCWSQSPNPTIALPTKTSNGSGISTFTSSVFNLNPNTSYYLRAYATNSNGTSYGNEVVFSTTDYEGVTIGGQIWMAKNLSVPRYSNGDLIPQVSDPTQWVNLTTGAWCWCNNDSVNYSQYGRLYNWYAVNDPRGLAPQGWHISTEQEWNVLSNYLGGNSVSGGKLKEAGTSHWNSPNLGATNSSGFTALPGGRRDIGTTFFQVTYYGYWWLSSNVSGDAAPFRSLGNTSVEMLGIGGTYFKIMGLSVRCVRN